MIRFKSDFVNKNNIRHQILIFDDEVSSPSNISITNPVWQDSLLNFVGGSDPTRFTVPVSTGNISVSLWARFTSADFLNSGTIFSQYGINGNRSLGVKNVSGVDSIQFITYTNTEAEIILSAPVSPNNLYHIVVIEDSRERYLYIDGVLKDFTMANFTIYSSEITVGCISPGLTRGFEGLMLDFRTWDFGIDIDTITHLYNEIYNIIGTESIALMLYEGGGEELRDFSEATSLPMAASAYTLDWDFGITDVLEGGICQSECKLQFINSDGVLDDFLEDLRTCGDYRFTVEIRKNYSAEWRGVLLQDYVKYPDTPYTVYEISANDGMGLLKSLELDDTDLGNGSFGDIIYKGLERIAPSLIIPDGYPLLYIRTNWFAEYQDTDQESLHYLSTASALIWRENRQVEVLGTSHDRIGYMYWYDVIEHILQRFNAFLIQSRGHWFLSQRPYLLTGVNIGDINYYWYEKTNGYNSLSTKKMNIIETMSSANSLHRSNGQLYNLPAIGKIYGIYALKGNASFLGTDTPEIDTVYTTVPVLGSVGGSNNYLEINIHLSELLHLTASEVEVPLELQRKCKLQIKKGTYYLQEDGTTWDTAPAYVEILSSVASLATGAFGTTFGDANPYSPVVGFQVSFQTDNLPGSDSTPEPLSVKLYDFDFEIETPEDAYDTLWVEPLEDYEAIFDIKVFYDSYSVPEYAYFENTNSNTDYKLLYATENGRIGSTGGWFPVGHIRPFVSPSFGDYANLLWSRGASGTKDQYFTALLITEILRQQTEPPHAWNGDIYSTDDKDISAYVVLRGGTKYFFPNKLTYSPLLDVFSGDWIEITTGTVTHIPVGDTVLEGREQYRTRIPSTIHITGQLERFRAMEEIVDIESGAITTGGGDIDTNHSDSAGTPGKIMAGNISGLDITLEGDVVLLPNIPTSSSGLTTGQVWNDSGVLKIVM